MKQTKRFFTLWIGLALLLLTACHALGFSNSAALPAGSPAIGADADALEDLDSVEELQEIFNQDAGKTRLVLLLSPT